VAVDAGRQGWHGRGVRSLLRVGVGVGVAVAACGNVVEEEVATTKVGTQATPTNVNLDVEGDSQSPSLVIDATGNAHLLFYWIGSGLGAGYGARYGECSSNCDTLASWRFVTLDVPWAVSPLVLDSKGRPRFLVTGLTPHAMAATLTYASCDEDCTATASWTFTRLSDGAVPGGGPVPDAMPLAIDAHGTSWVAFTSGATQLTLASCETRCTDAAHWTSTAYTTRYHFFPRDLGVDKAGTAHMTEQYGNAYVEIATGPTSAQTRTLNAPDTAVRMRLDSSGHPRIIYQGREGLDYAWCNKDCAAKGTWAKVSTLAPQASEDPGDFVLDSAGLPHIAFGSPSHPPAIVDDLRYATCSAHCGTPQMTFRIETIQSSSDLETGTPTRDGGGGSPFSGLVVSPVSVALDPSGAPRFAYEVTRPQFCSVITDGPGYCYDTLRYSAP
jgi:hypothetical protein